MLKLVVLVSGGGTNLQAIIDSITNGTITNAEISVVISNNANAYALERARKHGIEARCISPKQYETREAFNEALLAAIQSYGVDLVVLAGCLVVIPEIMVKAYPNRIINIHPALLPLFPGLHTHQRALDAGMRVAGCTVHFVTEGMDEGPIIAQAAVPVLPGDTADTLAARVLTVEHRVYPETLRLFASGQVRMDNGRTVFSGQDAADDSQTIVSA